MNRIVKKWFWVWQQDQEKAFLEEQSKEGYHLIKVAFGKYIFEKSESQKRIYQMDFKSFSDKLSEEEYLQLYEDAGWNYISSLGGWYYFYQDWKEGVDQSLFNDNESKSKVYRRLIGFLFLTGFPLYYQVIFILPAIEDSSFMNIFRIIMTMIAIVHLLAVLKLFSMYMNLKKSIRE